MGRTLSISEVAARTGVGEGTLRMWERRHGFPVPERLPSGRRRYSETQLEQIRRVVTAREAGLSLAASIQQALREPGQLTGSLFATLRRRCPEVEARTLTKPLLIALSHAIEDEALARGEHPILFASFQHERFYRSAEPRWREFARGALLAAVFADFPRLELRRDAPAELPVDARHPLHREWAIVCEAEGYAVCLAGREPPSSSLAAPASERRFEVVWSVEPRVVHEASRACVELAAPIAPELVEPVRARLEPVPTAPGEDQLRLAAAITNRTLAYLSR